MDRLGRVQWRGMKKDEKPGLHDLGVKVERSRIIQSEEETTQGAFGSSLQIPAGQF